MGFDTIEINLVSYYKPAYLYTLDIVYSFNKNTA